MMSDKGYGPESALSAMVPKFWHTAYSTAPADEDMFIQGIHGLHGLPLFEDIRLPSVEKALEFWPALTSTLEATGTISCALAV